MRKMPDLDWTQHIKMDYTLNLRKNPAKAKIRPSEWYYMILLAHLTVRQNQEFAAISWNLIKIAIFKEIMAIVNLEMIKIYEFVLESAKYSDSNIHFICS